MWLTPHMSTASTGFGARNTLCFWWMWLTFFTLDLSAEDSAMAAADGVGFDSNEQTQQGAQRGGAGRGSAGASQAGWRKMLRREGRAVCSWRAGSGSQAGQGTQRASNLLAPKLPQHQQSGLQTGRAGEHTMMWVQEASGLQEGCVLCP